MPTSPFQDPAYAADLDVLKEVERSKARLFARESRTLVSLYGRTSGPGWEGSAPTESMLMEVAGTVRIGQRSASDRLGTALHLVDSLPGLLGELEAGRVFVPQAMVVIDETCALSEEKCALVEARVLPWVAQ